MKSIVFNVYFGSISEEVSKAINFSYSENPNITLALVTDARVTFKLNNIVVLRINDFLERLQHHGIPYHSFFKNPYKLCDLKTFLPLLYEDLCFDYDYVGWVDLDILLSRRISQSVALAANKSQEIVGGLGHFTLVRRDISAPLLRDFFERLRQQFPDCFSGRSHLAVDEFRFFHVFLKSVFGNDVFSSFALRVADIAPYRLTLKLTDGSPFRVGYISQDIIIGDKSFDYIHYQQRRLKWMWSGGAACCYVDNRGYFVIAGSSSFIPSSVINPIFARANLGRIKAYVLNHGLFCRPKLQMDAS